MVHDSTMHTPKISIMLYIFTSSFKLDYEDDCFASLIYVSVQFLPNPFFAPAFYDNVDADEVI